MVCILELSGHLHCHIIEEHLYSSNFRDRVVDCPVPDLKINSISRWNVLPNGAAFLRPALHVRYAVTMLRMLLCCPHREKPDHLPRPVLSSGSPFQNIVAVRIRD
jgi:hypothetical protein